MSIPPNPPPYDHSLQIKSWQWPFFIVGLSVWFFILAIMIRLTIMISGDEKCITWIFELM